MKASMKQKVLIAVVAGLLAAGPVAAKDTEKTTDSGVVEEISVVPARVVTPDQQQVLANAAANILRQIASARGAIHDKKPEAAKEDLQKVDSLIKIIKAGRPVAKVKDHIWVAKKHLDYENTQEVAADLIPIYSDFIDIEDFIPVEQARKDLDKAGESLKKGDKKAAKEQLAAVDEAMVYTEIDLPLSNTERQVELARGFLDQDKLQEADNALKAAEDGVQLLSMGVESPLVKAHHSLLQATENYTAKKYDAAKADLKKAGSWIERAGKSGDKKIRQEAAKLEKSLEHLEDKLK